MKTSRKSKVSSSFDVTEFLRPDDKDLRSALASLMGREGERENSTPGIELRPGLKSIPDPKLRPGLESGSGIELIPGPELTTAVPAPPRSYPLRRAQTAEEGHSRGEKEVYEALWRAGEPVEGGARRVRIGMLGLARKAGLSESNVRLNLRNLVRKLAVEEESAYICEVGQGRTWRVFPPDQVLRRRQAAGMEWYRKRTLAVVFVPRET